MSAKSQINQEDFQLNSGSKVCVVGGGPAGSFFSYFLLDLAKRVGVDIELDIIEVKNFFNLGPSGCNHCGGIISESLVQALATEGIVLPSNVINRGIDSYVMHTDDTNVKIITPLEEKRIGSVFRGSGPLGAEDSGFKSFDKYLQEMCIENGANLINDKVTEINFTNGRPHVITKSKIGKTYDLVVGAVGLDNKSLKMLKGASSDYESPNTTKTYISEFYLGEEIVSKHFGNSMHVFLMNIPNLEFGALIPKGHYVTLVLLGNEIDRKLIDRFLKSPEVIGCFPDTIQLSDLFRCQCYPKINTAPAKHMYGDRFVAIGDSGTSKLYKNGIGAAYITAKAAATTVLLNGISSKDFEKYFMPACRSLHFDNSIGKIVFLVTKLIKVSSLLKRGVVRMVSKEQKKGGDKRNMSIVLWDTFTGSAPYKEIFLRSMKPTFLISLVWNTISASRRKQVI